MRVIPACGGLLSFVALILLAVGMATDHWIDFELGKSSPLNPKIVNDELVQKIEARSGKTARAIDFTTTIEYNVRHYGLWIGCYMERSAQVNSCSYIGSKCYTDVCWVRKSSNDRTETCKDTRMKPLTNCGAYQFTRAFICIAILLMILGTSTQMVSLMTYNRTLAAVAGVVVVIASIIAMMGFSIFYSEEFAKNGVSSGKLSHLPLLFIFPLLVTIFAVISNPFIFSWGNCCTALISHMLHFILSCKNWIQPHLNSLRLAYDACVWYYVLLCCLNGCPPSTSWIPWKATPLMRWTNLTLKFLSQLLYCFYCFKFCFPYSNTKATTQAEAISKAIANSVPELSKVLREEENICKIIPLPSSALLNRSLTTHESVHEKCEISR